MTLAIETALNTNKHNQKNLSFDAKKSVLKLHSTNLIQKG